MATAAKKSSVAKIDSLTLKPSECKIAIQHMMTTQVALFLWGPPGVAKSAITNQVATNAGIALVDIRLSQMEPTDMRGIPMPVQENGLTGIRWSAPTLLPRDLNAFGTFDCEAVEETIFFNNPIGDNGIHHVQDIKATVTSLTPNTTVLFKQTLTSLQVSLVDKAGDLVAGRIRYHVTGEARAILMLDEFNSAAQSVQAGAYQLVLDRRLGEYVVPNGVMVMAAGNRENDKGITFRMPTPIANRFTHIEIRPDFDDWQAWALNANVHKNVVGFLSAFKHKLFEFDAASASRGFATPRSWDFVSKIIKGNPNLPEQVLLGLISGAIGDGVALEFHGFCRNADDLPSSKDILTGVVKKLKSNDVALCYALTTALCYELRELENEYVRTNSATGRAAWMKMADTFFEFMMENFQPEVTIMGAKTAMGVMKLKFVSKEMKSFETFLKKYKSLIM